MINMKYASDSVKAERAFQKQPTVFLNRKKLLGQTKKFGSGKIPRYTRNVGLGFKPPTREAINFLPK